MPCHDAWTDKIGYMRMSQPTAASFWDPNYIDESLCCMQMDWKPSQRGVRKKYAVIKKYLTQIFVVGIHVFNLTTPFSVKWNELPPCLNIASGLSREGKTFLVSNTGELENVCLI